VQPKAGTAMNTYHLLGIDLFCSQELSQGCPSLTGRAPQVVVQFLDELTTIQELVNVRKWRAWTAFKSTVKQIQVSMETFLSPTGEVHWRTQNLHPDGHCLQQEYFLNQSADTLWCGSNGGHQHGPVSEFVCAVLIRTILARHGIAQLHGSALCGRQGAVALLGHSGDGKSTTAALLARQASVVADDILALSLQAGQPSVFCGRPWLRIDGSKAGQFAPLKTRPIWSPGFLLDDGKVHLECPAPRENPIPLRHIVIFDSSVSQLSPLPDLKALQKLREHLPAANSLLPEPPWPMLGSVVRNCQLWLAPRRPDPSIFGELF
jgi:hypothetical protein